MKAALVLDACDGITADADWWAVGVSQASDVHGAACC